MTNMQISFNGIKNLYIGKKQNDAYGSYLSSDNDVKQGDKHYTTVKISCELTDDENGNDLTKFNQAVTKSKRYDINTLNNRVDMLLIRQDIKNEPVSMSNFKLNNRDMTIYSDKDLPMYTYMAYLTRKIQNLPNISDARKHYAQLVNKSVEEEARKYLDL